MHNIKTIEKLLKDELSATETYQQALEKFRVPGGQFVSNSLMPIFGNHKAAASSLEAQIRKLGGTPHKSTGAWGSWAKLILEGASLLGKQSAIKVLLEGEKSGEADYEKALQTPDLSADIRALIETKLLPAQQSHVRSLDRLLDATPA
ncbi:DUF2383 domain-containing protein [Methyloglobulus sp.]|uniref:DUF2383 domain-containing protein n=1 Tax=Methyloglobulus sp. TaxID=2518622 RepID=UPI003988F115